ncbi:actin interacting protein 3-domain-containing protein [Multifurca ochricompacta]|uniref:Actin interacting protein 3-domain-containing protein n=1 Tax=Multifurca ochricompacta TaxID=376703 RepID=A0AAD4M209_9AGAM|nr:actin interacting protein 3-domain-containing protein [Multifurca ochricompacta]
MAVKQPIPPPTSGTPPPRNDHTRSSSSSGKMRPNPVVESTVTRLLVSIKQLLECLTQWSSAKSSEEDVSDVYVRLGNDFNAAVAAFAFYEIDMSELLGFPDDLRIVLEECLSEDASSATLEKYLPQVRSIITKLLQELRLKQSKFREIVSSNKPKSDASGHSRSDSVQVSRSSRTHSRRDTRSSSSTTYVDDGSSRRSTQSSATSSRRKESGSYEIAPSSDGHFVGGFVFPPPLPGNGQPPGTSGRSSHHSGDPRPPSGPPINLPPPPATPPQNAQLSELELDPEGTPIALAKVPQVPATVKRYSLVDKPMQPPSVVIDESTLSPSEPDRGNTRSPPLPELPAVDTLTANLGVASSLAALKSDALERRASKRFSTYNISKMTGAPRERSGVVNGNSNRRSLVAGGGGALTATELAVLTEADEDSETPPQSLPQPLPRRQRSVSRTRGPPSGEAVDGLPPVPPLPRTPFATSQPSGHTPGESSSLTSTPEPAPNVPSAPQPITVFLQAGREVKKAQMEPGLTFSSLRMLFVDKFAYNPGQEDFPAIYIRDPSSGVQYELEDADEVKDRCLLSLNIEPLDQIKQHIDAQISGLAQELRDLRKTVSENHRSSVIIPPAPVIDDMDLLTPAPTDRQLQKVARRLSRLVQREGTSTQSEASVLFTPLVPQETGQSLLQPQTTGSSVMSEYSIRIVSDLRTQFDEVQNLRRDLGTMRQLYTEFMRQTKETLSGLRTQTQTVRQMASVQVPGARAYIDAGKKKLDARSQDVLTKMEELQDTVESVRDDVLKRHVSPKPQVLRSIKEGLTTASTELESLKEHIKTIKPMWKKTWEEELQSIVEEQQFLNHQEEFLADLIEDSKAVSEIYSHMEKVISIRGASGGRGARGRGFRPPPLDKDHGGLSTVMLEIRGAAVDPERRLKAIEASQKNRERELAGRSDEFEAELKGFVGGKKLKMTGGAEETERVRQHKNDLTLKAIFGGNSSPAQQASLAPTPVPAPVAGR